MSVRSLTWTGTQYVVVDGGRALPAHECLTNWRVCALAIYFVVQLQSATARWQRIYAYLHSSSLDEHFATFLADEALFISQHFDDGALVLSEAHIETIQTLFEMTRGVQFSDQTDVIAEATTNRPSGGGASSSGGAGRGGGDGGEMLHIPIPTGLVSGDKWEHITDDGDRIQLRVPEHKKGGDTILCLYVVPTVASASSCALLW